MADSSNSISQQPHHVKQELCTNRPPYRAGRKLTAVKVYTVSDESQHLLIHGVPAISVTAELENLCSTFGSIEFLRHVPDYPAEKFCEVYHVKFHTFQSARFAKRKMDDRSFYGGVLHVCYAPELETIEETRYKLVTREREIIGKLNPPSRPQSLRPHPHPPEEAEPPPPQLLPPSSFPSATASDPVAQPIPPSKTAASRAPAIKRIVYHKRVHQDNKRDKKE